MAVRWMLRRTHNTCFAAKDDVRFAVEYVGQLLGVGRHLAIIGRKQILYRCAQCNKAFRGNLYAQRQMSDCIIRFSVWP